MTMQGTAITLLPGVSDWIQKARMQEISAERRGILRPLIDFIQRKVDAGEPVHLNFICTHNSRRSQFLQVWAQTVADVHGVDVNCCSGGVEVTEFNPRAVASIRRSGFQVVAEGDTNPVYSIRYAEHGKPIVAYSKMYHDPANQQVHFAAVMTCSHADETCVFVPGAEVRIPVRYDDPKQFDDTPQEAAAYDATSLLAASEMIYVFSEIKLPK